MQVTFYGAAQEVTGSCYLLETQDLRILVDCGLFQGHQENLDNTLHFDPTTLDVVIVTHAHIDHCGRLPLLIKQGYQGPIYAIRQTAKLMEIMLRDAANIQERNALDSLEEAQYVEPLYTMEEVEQTLRQVHICDYQKPYPYRNGLVFDFNDAGHLLGSSSLRLQVSEDDKTTTLVFSGDIGNQDQPLILDPIPFTRCDVVFVESTYADRNHSVSKDRVQDLATIFNHTFQRGGDVIVPSFAVGRTQTLLFYIREMKQRHLVPYDFEVFVDSPMATRATQVFMEELYEVADEETKALYAADQQPMLFKGLQFTEDVQASRALNFNPNRKVIIASSGMCEAGRIVHHLKNRLGKKEDTVLFVGYQAEGTLGQRLLSHPQEVTILDKKVKVKAEIVEYKGMSGHADQKGLNAWLSAFDPKPNTVFIVHGEREVSAHFQSQLTLDGYNAILPNTFQTYTF